MHSLWRSYLRKLGIRWPQLPTIKLWSSAWRRICSALQFNLIRHPDLRVTIVRAHMISHLNIVLVYRCRCCCCLETKSVLRIEPSDYITMTGADCSVKLYVKGTVTETGQSYATQHDVAISKPKLKITVSHCDDHSFYLVNACFVEIQKFQRTVKPLI